MKKAYLIYRALFDENSPAHFWEYTNRPEYLPSPDDFTPSEAWDDFQQVGLSVPDVTHWYFISYPLRKQISTSASNTIAWLVSNVTNPNNPMMIIKDDDGNWYTNPAYP